MKNNIRCLIVGMLVCLLPLALYPKDQTSFSTPANEASDVEFDMLLDDIDKELAQAPDVSWHEKANIVMQLISQKAAACGRSVYDVAKRCARHCGQTLQKVREGAQQKPFLYSSVGVAMIITIAVVSYVVLSRNNDATKANK
jgi:hypothetical protein